MRMLWLHWNHLWGNWQTAVPVCPWWAVCATFCTLEKSGSFSHMILLPLNNMGLMSSAGCSWFLSPSLPVSLSLCFSHHPALLALNTHCCRLHSDFINPCSWLSVFSLQLFTQSSLVSMLFYTFQSYFQYPVPMLVAPSSHLHTSSPEFCDQNQERLGK